MKRLRFECRTFGMDVYDVPDTEETFGVCHCHIPLFALPTILLSASIRDSAKRKAALLKDFYPLKCPFSGVVKDPPNILGIKWPLRFARIFVSEKNRANEERLFDLACEISAILIGIESCHFNPGYHVFRCADTSVSQILHSHLELAAARLLINDKELSRLGSQGYRSEYGIPNYALELFLENMGKTCEEPRPCLKENNHFYTEATNSPQLLIEKITGKPFIFPKNNQDNK